MKLKNIGAKNFWSFKDLSYTFEDKPIQVNGLNLTDDGQDSNGSGKSALLAIIQLIWLNVQYVYMETERKSIKKETLVNFDAKEAKIWGEINCPIRKETLKVERIIKKTGSASQLSINGVIKYAFEDKMVDELDKFIIDWIGISKDDLLNFYFVNKEKHKSLYTSNNNTKLEVYNRFSNANIIDGIDVFVKEDVTKTETKLSTAQTAIDNIHGEIAATERRVITERERDLKQELIDRVNGYQEKIKSFRETNLTSVESKETISNEAKLIELDIKELNRLLIETNEKLSKFDLKPLNEQIHQITEKRSQIRLNTVKKGKEKESFNETIDEATEMLNEIERNIKGSVSCPKCKHKFVVGKENIDIELEKENKVLIDSVILEARDNIAKIQKSIIKIKDSEIVPLDSKESKINIKISEFNKSIKIIRGDIEDIDTELDETTQLLATKQHRLRTLDSSIEETLLEISSYEQKIVDSKNEDIKENVRLKELANEVIELNKKLKIKELEHSLIKDELFEVTQWIHNFKRFKGHLANKSLKVIQGHLNHYLTNMDTDMRIKMEGFKLNSKKETVESITPYVIRDGSLRLFGSFSGGERARMIYAELLTFMHLINSTNKYGGLWFSMSDELAEGCDGLGLQNIIKSMVQFEFPILVTTHVVDRSVNDNKLVVVKENGVSTIKVN